MKRTIVFSLLVFSVIQISLAQRNYGIIKYSANFMRSAPDYESSLETQALMGAIAEVRDTSSYWLKIHTPEPSYTAWATDMGVFRVDSLQLSEYIAAPKYICTAMWSELLSSPDKDGLRKGDFVAGDLVRILYDESGRPLKRRHLSGVILPAGDTAFVSTADIEDFQAWSISRKAVSDNLIKEALKYLGTPYMWGGNSPGGLDCSGLIRNVFFMNGILLPRNASRQAQEGIGISIDGFVPGYSEGSLLPGDLMFFGKKAAGDSHEVITHVAMYIGGGRIIHSSQEVRINSLDANSKSYYTGTPRLLKVRRICDEEGQPYTSVKIIDSPYYFPDKMINFANIGN